MRNLIGTQLGQYQLTEVIRRGGMATVYKAYQESLDRYVAVKVLFHGQDPQFVARFQREARAIAHLQHPNILPIFDNGEQDGLLYLVLQYIERGMTLGDLLGHPMELVPALQLMVRVLSALDYAHERGIVHRDIKPANILMPTPSWPMLADFGIAKLLTESDNPNLTAQGMIIGTAAYVAPEQVLGQHIDRRTDLYSAGIVLYEIVAGRVPFDHGTPIVVATKQAYEAPPSPRDLNPDLPPAVETVVLRALEKDPANRFQTAAEMADALERLARHLGRTGARSEVSTLYHAGVSAFEAGRWDLAIMRLRQVVQLDPSYEDASQLLEAAESARTHQDRNIPPAAPQSVAVPATAAPVTPFVGEDVLPVAAGASAVAGAPPAAVPAVALPPPEQAPIAPAVPPLEEIVPPAAPEAAPPAPEPTPPIAVADAAPPALSPPVQAAPPAVADSAPPPAAGVPTAAEVVLETTPAATGTAAGAPQIPKPPARKRPRRAPKPAPLPPLLAESPASAPATTGATAAPEVVPLAAAPSLPPAVEAGAPLGTPTVIAPAPEVAPVPAPAIPPAEAQQPAPLLEPPAPPAAPPSAPAGPEIPTEVATRAADAPTPQTESEPPPLPTPPELVPPPDAVADAIPPSVTLTPAVLPAISPATVSPAPDLDAKPAASLAWRAPALPVAPVESPGGVESLPVVEDSPPATPPVVNMEAAVVAHPRMVEQEAARPAAPARQRRMAPILAGGITVVLLLLAGAAFLFRPPAPPATTTPTALGGVIPSAVTAGTVPPPTAPPTTAVPATPETVVAAAPTVTVVAATATPPPVASPSPAATAIAVVAAPPPAGNLVWQDNFNPPAATPTLEYDLYALVSRSGLENDFDYLNTPGSTAGFQHPGTYRIQFDSPNQSRAVALARFAYSAFTMQIELSDASDATATGNLGQGVVVRERDRDHLYAVLLNSRSGQYTVRKLDGKDRWSDLLPWTASPLIKPGGAANRLRVDGTGDQFTIYLNDALLAHFSDGAYPFGMLGLMGTSADAGKTVLDFDNLTIWSSDTPAGPPATLDAARGMILIPGGEFIMGWYAKPEEQAHIVAVPSFYLDPTEVTNKAYKQCIAAGKCSPPATPAPGDAHANDFKQAQFDSYPVIYVSWTQAQTFCGWAKKRLPTEAEWEKAASWDSTTGVKAIWPWADNRYDPQRLNSQESSPGYTTAVQHFGPELNGTFDMAGNVREWTSSLNKPYPYDGRDGQAEGSGPGDRVYRGGSWLHTWGKAQTFFREGSPPGDQTADVGFRCAATP